MDAPAGPLPWPPPGVLPEARPPSFFERVPARPLAFGGLLFALGWAGILFQHGVLRQLVIGAPVFEEMAKFGLALVLVTFLRIRWTWLRMPFAWASGAGFGVLEHFLTYSDEPPLFWGLRIAFHLATAGLSMAAYGLLEPMEDARVRWVTTITSSILHAANNLGALVFAVFAFIADTDPVATVYSVLVTGTALTLTAWLLARRERARARAMRILQRVFGTLNLGERPAPAPAPLPPPDPPGP